MGEISRRSNTTAAELEMISMDVEETLIIGLIHEMLSQFKPYESRCLQSKSCETSVISFPDQSP